MKHTTRNFLYALLAATAIYGCSKSNNYTTTDHTTGITGKVRSWSGATSGYVKTDTVIMPDTNTVNWATFFNRTISDSFFAVMEVNGFQVSVFGTPFNYLTTDSVNQVIIFDTTLSGSAKSILTYYYNRDSMTCEYHQVTGYSNWAKQNYQVNYLLHTD
jgi:hypothetical protein